MKKILLAALMAISVVASAQEKTKPLPTTKVRSIDGKPIAFNQVVTPGKVTIISFWATWCIPCKKEIKAIQGKLPAWQRETPDLEFAAVSIDDARALAQVKTFTKTQGWTWPVYLDPNSDLKRSLNFSNVPFTIIVDKNGNVAYMHTGYEDGGEDDVYEIAKKIAEAK
jgi:thiol-disulfide isomerase/thioredoxin